MAGKRASYVDVNGVNYLVHHYSIPYIDDFFDTNGIRKAEMVNWATHETFILYYEDNSNQPEISELNERFGVSFCGTMLLFKRQKNGTFLTGLNSATLEEGMKCVEWFVF